MKMLQRTNTLQALPILKPHHISLPAKRALHIRLDLLPRLWRRAPCRRVVCELEFRPYDEVHDVGVDAVGPVVVEDFDVGSVGEGRAGGGEGGPAGLEVGS